MNEQELQRIRDGFAERVREAFEMERSKPLVRAAKRPPLAPGRSNYIRHYSWSIIDFAARCYFLNEQIEEANAALAENTRHYLDNPKDITDPCSFHWHAEMYCRLLELYGGRGSVGPGRLKPQTEEAMMEVLWTYAELTKAGQWDPRNTYNPRGSDNHHTMDFIAKWHFAKLAKDHARFRNRKYEDGRIAADHYASWNEYISAYCLDHARKGLFAEVASDNYNIVGMKGFYNVYDFADDPVVKRRAGFLLDLHWAMWAQEQIDGVRGGGRTRIYQTGDDRLGNSDMRSLAWFFFGIGATVPPVSPMLSALTSTYRPPLAVIDLALDIRGRGRYEVCHRPIGLGQRAYLAQSPSDEAMSEKGGMVCYSWCTPGFILGTPMVEARRAGDWPNVASQNRWHGVIFAGNCDARIVPQVRGKGEREVYNAQWSVQRKGTLICQKLKTHRFGEEMRIWFSEPGLTNRSEENGWIFVEAPEAFAAVRIINGGWHWEDGPVKPSQDFLAKDGTLSDDTPGAISPLPASMDVRFAGSWIWCHDEWTPVILEVGCKEDFENYTAYRKAVAALPLSFVNDVLAYRGLSGDDFTFFADQTRSPEINGECLNYAPGKVLDSAFIQSDYNSGVVKIKKNNHDVVLDFRES